MAVDSHKYFADSFTLPFVRVIGAYEGGAPEYLDTYSRLFREDCLARLREAVASVAGRLATGASSDRALARGSAGDASLPDQKDIVDVPMHAGVQGIIPGTYRRTAGNSWNSPQLFQQFPQQQIVMRHGVR